MLRASSVRQQQLHVLEERRCLKLEALAKNSARAVIGRNVNIVVGCVTYNLFVCNHQERILPCFAEYRGYFLIREVLEDLPDGAKIAGGRGSVTTSRA